MTWTICIPTRNPGLTQGAQMAGVISAAVGNEQLRWTGDFEFAPTPPALAAGLASGLDQESLLVAVAANAIEGEMRAMKADREVLAQSVVDGQWCDVSTDVETIQLRLRAAFPDARTFAL